MEIKVKKYAHCRLAPCKSLSSTKPRQDILPSRSVGIQVRNQLTKGLEMKREAKRIELIWS